MGIQCLTLGYEKLLTKLWRHRENTMLTLLVCLVTCEVGRCDGENLHALNAKNIEIPVMLGGAALTRHWAESHLRSIYNGSLYYGRDAFEGTRSL